MDTSAVVEAVGRAVDLVGVGVIVLGAVFVTVVAVRRLVAGAAAPDDLYAGYRRGLGRTILLGRSWSPRTSSGPSR